MTVRTDMYVILLYVRSVGATDGRTPGVVLQNPTQKQTNVRTQRRRDDKQHDNEEAREAMTTQVLALETKFKCLLSYKTKKTTGSWRIQFLWRPNSETPREQHLLRKKSSPSHQMQNLWSIMDLCNWQMAQSSAWRLSVRRKACSSAQRRPLRAGMM